MTVGALDGWNHHRNRDTVTATVTALILDCSATVSQGFCPGKHVTRAAFAFQLASISNLRQVVLFAKNKSVLQTGLGDFSVAVYCKRAVSSLVTCTLSPSLHRLLMLWGNHGDGI